jgi:hypothetical protein
MAEYVVAKGGTYSDERVTADEYRFTEAGALVFYNVVPPAASRLPGQRTHDQLVMAFAPGRWVEVIRSETVAADAEIEAHHKDQRTFPPGCSCERINVDTTHDVPGTQFVRGRSDPPCKVHLPKERALYDHAYTRACIDTQAVVSAVLDHVRCASRANQGIAQLGGLL